MINNLHIYRSNVWPNWWVYKLNGYYMATSPVILSVAEMVIAYHVVTTTFPFIINRTPFHIVEDMLAIHRHLFK